MQANHIGILPSLMLVFIYSKAIVAQNITNVQVESINCSHVVVKASIDPVSSTYTFTWVLSINGGSDIELVLVGLDGNGNVGEMDQSSGFTYILNNDPSSLPNNNDPFTSRLTFMFVETASENLIFKTVSTPLDISIPEAVNKPKCPSTDQNQNVSCSDGSEDCFCPESNIPANITCPCGETLLALCNENYQFDFSTCPFGCPMTIQNLEVTCADGSQNCFYCNSNISASFTCSCGVTLISTCSENGVFDFGDCPQGCSMTEQNQNVFCSDNSQDCFCPGSNIPASITCPCGENLTAICNESSQFNFPTCISRCLMMEQNQNVFCSDNSQDCFCPGSNILASIRCPCGENLTAICNESSQFNFSTCVSRCPMMDQNLVVSCSDSTEDCFCPASNISANITCSSGENFTSLCNENSQFNFPTCPSSMPLEPRTNPEVGIALEVIGGVMVVTGIIGLVLVKQNVAKSFANSNFIFGAVVGFGAILCGIGLVVWIPSDAGYVAGGSILMAGGIAVIATCWFFFCYKKIS